jgi:hypothetical protein
MRRPVVHYRDTPKFVRRRLNHIAGEVNTILLVVALGLGMLDLLLHCKNRRRDPAGRADGSTRE